ncbi:hypothetical protein ACU4GG_31035 [Streptomyces nojiriensis]
MTALLRYQGALLLRSQRWIAPLVVYAAFVAAGIRPGDPVPDSSASPPPGWSRRRPGSCGSASPTSPTRPATARPPRPVPYGSTPRP